MIDKPLHDEDEPNDQETADNILKTLVWTLLWFLVPPILALFLSSCTQPEPEPVCEIWSGSQIIFLPCRSVW